MSSRPVVQWLIHGSDATAHRGPRAAGHAILRAMRDPAEDWIEITVARYVHHGRQWYRRRVLHHLSLDRCYRCGGWHDTYLTLSGAYMLHERHRRALALVHRARVLRRLGVTQTCTCRRSP